jgi:predicted RND superfamily exporter protein
VLLPAVLSVFPLRAPRPRDPDAGPGTLVRIMLRGGDLAADHPERVLALTALFVAVCLAGVAQVRFSHLATDWFEPDDPMRVAAELLDEKLRGTMSLEVVVDTRRENGLHDPDQLRRIERAMRWAEGVEHGDVFVGQAISIVDIVKETHQALNENRPAFRVVPDDRALIAQELLLFENGGAEDLEEIVDSQFSLGRISLRAPFVDAMHYGPFMDVIGTGMREILGDEVDIELTGFMPVLSGVVSAVIVSMARSYVIALLVITPLMILLLRDPLLGIVSMIPNLIPVIFVLGLMGWLDIPLDATNIMIGAMVIGLAVDDTIHFMHKFRIHHAASGDSREAIRETLTSTGVALLFTTLVLAGGFFTISFASMVNTQRFGMLAAMATGVAFLADVVVGPALMTLATRKRQSAAEPLLAEGR